MTLCSTEDEKNQVSSPDTPPPNLFETADLACALQQLAVSRERYHASIARRHKLSISELNCLCYCHAEGPLPSNRLADLLGVTPSAVTSMVNTLVRRGLADRSDHPRDRRVILVGATAAGSAIIDGLTRRLLGRIGLSAVDIAPTIVTLAQIAAALDTCTQDVAAAAD